MPTLVIDPNGLNLAVKCQRAGLAAPRRVGSVDNAGAGNERSFVTAELRIAPLTLIRVTPNVAKQIRDIFKKRREVETAGDVWLNDDPTTIVVASGDYTDDMETGGPYRTPSLTLYEVDNVDTAAYTATSSTIKLGNLDSPDDPGDSSIKLAGTKPSDDPFVGFGGAGSLELVMGVTIPTCGTFPNPAVNCPIAYSPAVEKTWLTAAAVADGWLTGAPTTYFLSSGGTGDRWQTQAYMAKIFVVRGGVDVAEWDTGWSDSNGGFSGGASTAVAPPIVFQGLTGDRLRVEVYGRAGLHGGYSDDGVHQTILFGNGGAAGLTLGGDVLIMWPPA